MIEALYGVEFSSIAGSGYGVVVLDKGHVLGGDFTAIYEGDYHLSGDKTLNAKIRITNDRNEGTLITGLENYTAVLNGTVNEKCTQFNLEGFAEEDPSIIIKVKMTRRAELP